jgi:hypothetical protein
VADLNKRLFDLMEANGAMKIPLFRDSGVQSNKRSANKEHAADFPDELKIKKP